MLARYVVFVSCVCVCDMLVSDKTAKLMVTQTMSHDSSGTLVFSVAKTFEWGHPQLGAKCRWGRLKSATLDK